MAILHIYGEKKIVVVSQVLPFYSDFFLLSTYLFCLKQAQVNIYHSSHKTIPPHLTVPSFLLLWASCSSYMATQHGEQGIIQSFSDK